MKKKMPDDPKPIRLKRDDHQHDETTRHLLETLRTTSIPVDHLKPTRARQVNPQSPFTVRNDVPALSALQHVSMLLKSAEEVSDEITEMASGVERGLVWSLVHSVEMARSLVDALLKGNGIDPEQMPSGHN